jgi:hypothetical protein
MLVQTTPTSAVQPRNPCPARCSNNNALLIQEMGMTHHPGHRQPGAAVLVIIEKRMA